MSVVKHILCIEGDEGQILASLDVVSAHDTRFIVNFSCLPEIQAQGYGTQLLTEAVASFGHEDLYVHALPMADRPLDEDKLMALYEKFGFERTGIFPGGMLRPANSGGK